MKHLLTPISIAILGVFFVACNPTNSQPPTQKATVSTQLLVEETPLDIFLADFRKALENNDKQALGYMCIFPMVNTICYDLETTQKVSEGGKEMILPKSSKKKFLQCYDQIFNPCIKKKLQYIRVKDLKTNGNAYEIDIQLEYYSPDGMPAGAGTFTMAISEINGKYYFTGIFCLGSCGGDC